MRKLIIIATGFLFAISACGQETAADKLDFNLNLQSNHLWRGLVVTDAPIVAVDINYALDNKNNLKVGVWGGMGLSEAKGVHYHEINYYLNYGTEKFGIGIWDVFNSTGRIKGEKNNDIWNYSRKTTGHRFDLRGYVVFSEKAPLKLEFGTSFYGDDRDIEADQRFSTYAELSYPVIKSEKINLTAFCGAGIGLTGESHFYGDGKNNFDIVNVGVTAAKEVPVLGYKLPVSATAMWNPSNKEARVQIAASLF